MSDDERFYSRWQKILTRQGAIAMHATSPVPYEAAYVWTPSSEVPILIEGEDAPAREGTPDARTFAQRLRAEFELLQGYGAAFRIRRRMRARWPVPGTEEFDDSVKDCMVVGVVHAKLEYPLYWASAKMGEHELPEKLDAEGNPVPMDQRAGLPPIMSEWIQVGVQEVPDSLSDLPVRR